MVESTVEAIAIPAAWKLEPMVGGGAPEAVPNELTPDTVPDWGWPANS